MDYNNELLRIIDKIRLNVDTQATAHNCYRPKTLSTASSPTAKVAAATTAAATEVTTVAPMTTDGVPNLIDFDDSQQHKHAKLTETSSYDGISIQNVCLLFPFSFFYSVCLSKKLAILLSFHLYSYCVYVLNFNLTFMEFFFR